MNDEFISDDPNDAEHDIRFFDLMESAGLIPPIPDAKARVMRLAKRLKLRILEWSRNPERGYFQQEFANGLDEP